MSLLPIVPHFEARVSRAQQEAVGGLAEVLLLEESSLTIEDVFRPLLPTSIEDAPTLHLDDLSDIPLLDHGRDVSFMQDRALLRAGDGDFVATCTAPDEDFAAYTRDRLGLGSPTLLHPEPRPDRLQLAAACWEDRQVRRDLTHALRSDQLLYIHPHMGNLPVWELGVLLHKAARRPLKVIAPPPSLTDWVNDKLAFSRTVARLFGGDFIPRMEQAANFALLSERVREMAQWARFLGIKIPSSAGGGGNIMVDTQDLQGLSLAAIRDRLKELLPEYAWQGETSLLIDIWETEVLSNASAQLWIPPFQQGPPLVEGLYEQMLEGRQAIFVGSRPVRFPRSIEREITDRCWLLARLYQRLGYIGRCSFDVLVVGDRLDDSSLKFIECNGRWGGTSLPMTVMNRLLGDWHDHPYAARECHADGLEKLRFADLLEFFADDLFDKTSREGTLVFYNPGRMKAHSAINVIAMAETWDEAHGRVDSEIPARLRELVAQRANRSTPAARS
jgi:hypothetical protein